MSPRRVTRPPRVPGTSDVRVRDCLRIVWWNERGFVHGARHGRGGGQVYSAALAVMWPPTLPLTIPIEFGLVARPWARYYMSPARDAVLAVVATATGWHIEDHSSARPGTGQGRALREIVTPALLRAADAEGVVIYTTAANATLAEQYIEELPGLADVGPGWPRGRRLRRDPERAVRDLV